MKVPLGLSLAFLSTTTQGVETKKAKRRFSAEPEKKKVAEKDRSQKLLPPKFVAEKYGLSDGDKTNHTIAKQVDEEARELGERPPNFFRVDDDEVLLLPEVFSQLNPDKVKRDFADPGDAEDERELRNSRWWGRLYVDGWPQTVQYLRAHFGEPPPEGARRFVLADPSDACGQLAGADYSGAIVLARRGTCTFSSKARTAAAAKAAALVLVNTEEGNDHLAGPDAHDVAVSVSMVAKADGDLLLKVFEERKRANAAAMLTASMMPIHCAEKSGSLGKELGTDLCAPATAAERALAKAPLEGGWLTLAPYRNPSTVPTPSPKRLEFMIATFGVVVDPAAHLEVVAAEPADGCAPLEGGGGLTFEEFNERHLSETSPGVEKKELVGSIYEGKAVLIKRGGCAFIDKAKAAQSAGAAMIVVENSHLGLSRFGVEPRWKGLGINIPAVMVTAAGGDALREAVADFGGAVVTASLSASVNAAVWDAVDKFRTGEAFGPAVTAKKKAAGLLATQRELHAGWPERLSALEEGYRTLGLGDSSTKTEL